MLFITKSATNLVSEPFMGAVSALAQTPGTRLVLHNMLPAYGIRKKTVCIKLCENSTPTELTDTCGYGIASPLQHPALRGASERAGLVAPAYMYVAGCEISIPKWLWSSTRKVVVDEYIPTLVDIIKLMLRPEYASSIIDNLPATDNIIDAIQACPHTQRGLANKRRSSSRYIKSLLRQLDEARAASMTISSAGLITQAQVEQLNRLTPKPYLYFEYADGCLSGVSIPVISGGLPLGSLKVSYDFVKDIITVTRPGSNDELVHPHVGYGGNACLGNISATINPELKAGRYFTGFLLLYNYLKSYNSRDVYWNTLDYTNTLQRVGEHASTQPGAKDRALVTGIRVCPMCNRRTLFLSCTCSALGCGCTTDYSTICSECDTEYCTSCCEACPTCNS